MDIAVACSQTHYIEIYLGYGNISFASAERFSTDAGSFPYSIAVADFNADARVDIVVANSGSNKIGIFLGQGNGSFGKQITFRTGHSPQFVAVADLDNDTIVDVLVANHDTNNVGVFRGHGNGIFEDMIPIPMKFASDPFSVVVGDFNNDRKLAFAVANDGTDSIILEMKEFFSKFVNSLFDSDLL